MQRWILASQSPRRRELLARFGHPFDVIPSEAEEKITTADAKCAVEELSCQKAGWVLERAQDGDVVIGSDTVVVLEGEILGKPKDEKDAFRMLSELQGRTHEVLTGVTVAVKGGPLVTFHEETEVHVAPMSEAEIHQYIATGEPMDKAGAYGIQGAFGPFITGITGDYYNVVGLPLNHLYRVLKEGGLL